MDNKTLKRIKLLVVAVLVLFVAGVAIEMVSGGARDFRRAWEAGMRESVPGAAHYFFVDIEPVDPDAHVIELTDDARFVTLSMDGELAVADHRVAARGRWNVVLNIVLTIVAAIALFAFIAAVIVFAVKFPRRKILDPANVRSLRWIAATLGVLALAGYGLMMNEHVWLSEVVGRVGYRVAKMPSPPEGIVVAAIVWALAEIMNLAAKLQNEQELTI